MSAEAAAEKGAWRGDAPSGAQSAAILFLGVVAVMIAGLQPLLLGALAQEGRLSAAQMGHAATSELLVMGIVAAVAGAVLPARNLRWIGGASALLLAGINLYSTRVSGEMLTLARGFAGAPSGLLLWIAIGMIARAPTPERWAGIFLTVQTLAQLAAAAVLTGVVPLYGSAAGFELLAGMSVVAAFAALVIPRTYAELAHADAPAGLPGLRGWAALAAIFLYLAFVVGVWVYAEPLSRQAGHAPGVAGAAVSLSLGCQVLGGIAATLLASRVKWVWALLIGAAGHLALIGVLASLPGPGVFLATAAAFGFLWLFVMPFMVPMTIEADPTRRAAVLIGGAQLLGSSLGPLLASVVVSDADARGALGLGAVCLVASALIVVGLRLMRTPPNIA